MKRAFLFSGLSIAALALAACGGGGGNNPLPITRSTPPPPVPTSTPFARPSGKPMAFYNPQNNATTQASARSAVARILAAHTLDATPSPAPSGSASPTASPSPTPTPIPTPTGLPQIPTRIGFAVGQTMGTGSGALVQVLDPVTNVPVQESTAPQVWTSDTNNIGICQDSTTGLPCVYPYTGTDPSFQYAWNIAFNVVSAAPPAHLQMAVKFPDSIGVSDIYRFDGFLLKCSQPAISFQNGVAVTGGTTDIGLDCPNNKMDIPGGYQDLGATQPDAFGSFIQDLHDVSSVGTFTPDGTSIAAPMVATLLDHIIIVKDSVGVYHKVMIWLLQSDGNGNITQVYGADLAADSTGTFPF